MIAGMAGYHDGDIMIGGDASTSAAKDRDIPWGFRLRTDPHMRSRVVKPMSFGLCYFFWFEALS